VGGGSGNLECQTVECLAEARIHSLIRTDFIYKLAIRFC
jgi:hypothetical protein